MNHTIPLIQSDSRTIGECEEGMLNYHYSKNHRQ